LAQKDIGHPLEKQCVEILEAYSTPKGPNRFGEVIDGHLRLTGRIIKGTLTGGGNRPRIMLPKFGDSGLHIIRDASEKEIYLKAITRKEISWSGRSFYWSAFPHAYRVPAYCLRFISEDYSEVYLILVESLRVLVAFERVAFAFINIKEMGFEQRTLLALWQTATEQQLTIV
jgi:hypothetical protein